MVLVIFITILAADSAPIETEGAHNREKINDHRNRVARELCEDTNSHLAVILIILAVYEVCQAKLSAI